MKDNDQQDNGQPDELIGNELRHWRTTRGKDNKKYNNLTQESLVEELAKKGYTYQQSNISKYETGRLWPPGQFLAHLVITFDDVPPKVAIRWAQNIGSQHFQQVLRDIEDTLEEEGWGE